MANVLYRIVYSVVVIVVAWLIKKYVTDSMVDAFAKKQKVKAGASKPIKNFFGIIIYVAAFFILLGIWNLRTTLTGLLAAAGMVVLRFQIPEQKTQATAKCPSHLGHLSHRP